MRLDKVEGQPDARVAWGSDIAAQMLRRFGIRYISLNPGASYRGFHGSLVNHLGNQDPGIILCLHEDHSVSIAHGYAKATGEPMACVLHSNVGLLHGMQGVDVLKKGGVCVIDLHVDPPAERQAAHALGHRATGE